MHGCRAWRISRLTCLSLPTAGMKRKEKDKDYERFIKRLFYLFHSSSDCVILVGDHFSFLLFWTYDFFFFSIFLFLINGFTRAIPRRKKSTEKKSRNRDWPFTIQPFSFLSIICCETEEWTVWFKAGGKKVTHQYSERVDLPLFIRFDWEEKLLIIPQRFNSGPNPSPLGSLIPSPPISVLLQRRQSKILAIPTASRL